MNKTLMVSAICAALAVQAGVATAQDASSRVDSFLPKGAKELSFAAQMSMPDEGEDSTFLFGSYGFQYSDNIQAKIGFSMFESGGNKSGTINPGADYIFQSQSDWVPYAGGSYGLNIGDFDDTDFFEVHVGAKKFVSESAAIFGELRKNEATDSDFSAFGSTVILVGLNFYFR